MIESHLKPFVAACLSGLLLWTSQAVADDAQADLAGPSLSVAWNVGAQTDYIYRGISQTGRNGSVFGGGDLSYGDYYLGAWASNVDLTGAASPDAEVDVYGGWRHSLAGVAIDLGLQQYAYVNTPSHMRAQYAEAYLKASRSIGPLSGGLSVSYSPKFRDLASTAPGKVNDETYVELNGAYAVDRKLSISGAIGRVAVSLDRPTGSTPKFTDYTTWNLGAAYAITDRVGLDLRYTDTDASAFFGEKYAGGRLVAQLKASF